MGPGACAELVGGDGISDGGADADHVVGVELGVVVNVVIANLGADEDVAPNVVADTAAEIFHEVIVAGVVDAAGDVARGRRKIETGAGDADAGNKVEAEFLAHTRLEECVEAGQDRAVGFIAVVVRLPYPEGGFDVQAEAAVLESDDVTADADVRATLFGGR